MNITLILQIAALAATALCLVFRLKYETQMAQQNSYRMNRYGKWLWGDLTSTVRMTDLMLFGIMPVFVGNPWMLGGVFFINILKTTKELKRKFKKPLVYTPRVKRTLAVEGALVVLWVVAAAVVGGMNHATMAMQAAVVIAPLITMAAFAVLTPVEKAINRWYYNDAVRILRSMPNLKIIAITGSYGKTSTKHYLYRILSEKYNVLMTPGSFNTTLGVIRTIREYLKPYHEVFIVEMGAKQLGDIQEICELVHPSMGIITAVGEQHLESFGCIENVQRTKFELVDALPADGLAVLNDDFKYIRERKVENVRAVRYGNNAEYNVLNTRYADDGTHFTVGNNAGWSLDLRTQLVGKYNLSNTLAGCIIARELGLSDDEIRISVADIQQVEHRLSIRRAGGLTIIDDAFNSNPHGSAMALEVLSTFTSGKRIVITPGMIELGAGQREHNRTLGQNMAASCDVAIVVGEFNRDAIVTGLVDGGFPAEQTIVVSSFAEATVKLREIAAPGDTVLYENDLPDTFK